MSAISIAEAFVSQPAVVSTSVRNDYRRRRALKRRDWTDHHRGYHRNNDRMLRWPQLRPFTGTEPQVGSIGEPVGMDELLEAGQPLDDDMVRLSDGRVVSNWDLEDDEDDVDDRFDEIAAIMSETPGQPGNVVWVENWDHRDPDPDQAIVGTTRPYAMGLLVA